MADHIENLMLEHLKRFQGALDRIERKQDEMVGRIGNLEGAVASLIQHLGHLAAADAAQQVAIDNVSRRLDRIERRLELAG